MGRQSRNILHNACKNSFKLSSCRVFHEMISSDCRESHVGRSHNPGIHTLCHKSLNKISAGPDLEMTSSYQFRKCKISDLRCITHSRYKCQERQTLLNFVELVTFWTMWIQAYNSQTGSGAHPVPYQLVLGAFSPRVKRPEG